MTQTFSSDIKKLAVKLNHTIVIMLSIELKVVDEHHTGDTEELLCRKFFFAHTFAREKFTPSSSRDVLRVHFLNYGTLL
jgi:hypothetical protein